MGFENGKVLRVALEATKGGDSQVNTFHYDLDDSIDLTGQHNDPQTLADAFRDNVRGHFADLYGSDWDILPVSVQMEKDPQNPNAARQAWASGAVIQGTKGAVTNLLPRSCCVVATLRTNNIGRRYRGRVFVGGSWNEGDQDNGFWQLSATGLVDIYLNAVPVQPDIQFGSSGNTAKLSVYSRTQRAADLDPYLSPVTAHVTRSAVHWLRSRSVA